MEQSLKNNQILVELQDYMGNDRAIANAAWTSSFNKKTREQKTDEQVADLVKRLARDGHSTPFESVVFRFWIRLPIFVDRQHMTHRIGSHNGLSGRYRTMPTDYFDIPEDVDTILEKVANLPNIFPTPTEPSTLWNIFDAYYESCEIATNNYRLSIDKLKHYEKKLVITNAEFKRAREILRGQLPIAGMTERTTIFNLRSFCNYLSKRTDPTAQTEIKQVAEMMLEEVIKANVCPIAIEALRNVKWIL